MRCLHLSRMVAVALLVAMQVISAAADHIDDRAEIIELLKIDETLDIVRQEGLRYGAAIAGDMQLDVTPEGWNSTVLRIYDPEMMRTLIIESLYQELSGTDLAPLLAYLRSDAGREVIRLELAVRRAFLVPGIEDAAKARFQRLKRNNADILDKIGILISDSDLVEYNVVGTLNSNLSFIRGLKAGGVSKMSEAEMLANVQSREDETRAGARTWLSAFFVMAYQPLPHDQMEAYTNFYQTPEGRLLNHALFAGYNRMYEEVSYRLGLAVAHYITSKTL